MKDLYKNYLFTKHILVSETNEQPADPFPVLVALGQKFGIRIHKHPELASEQMIREAERELGIIVPEPFYRGFPRTVREMTPDELLFDQLLHYTHTYGCGWFEDPGHSVFEGKAAEIERVIYNEHIQPKDFDILPAIEAVDALKESITDLMGSNRPLNECQLDLIREGWKDFGKDILPKFMPCKDTVIFMLYEFKDLQFCRYLKLSDVIKLLGYIQWVGYKSENLRKLNLGNQNRKLITNVINELSRLDISNNIGRDYCNYMECFEKRRIWCGLFHHIHYKPPLDNLMLGRFVSDVRNNKNYSAYAYFEDFMRKGNYKAAAITLVQQKSKSELIRHLNYILSRCGTDAEIEEVFKCLE